MMTSITEKLLTIVTRAGGTAVAESGILKLMWGGGGSVGQLSSMGG